MQAIFEAHFDSYLPLLSNRSNCCHFLTVLFNRVIHLLRKREWINDDVLLQKFQASIQSPSSKTQEIYQVFVDRIGQNPILEQIKCKIDAAHSDDVIKESSRPKMKMTHSRFHPELWNYAIQTRMFGSYNLDILLTDDGDKLSEKDKEQLKIHLKNSQDHNTLEYRKILLTWMLDVEKEERNEFRTFLESMLVRISKGESQEELKRDLRKVRKFLMNRDPIFKNNSGKSNGGNSYYVFQPLLEILFPGVFKNNYRCLSKEKYSIKNNRIYIPKRLSPREFDDKPHWAAGFVIGHNEHATTYIFDGSHYVWLDHDRKPNKLTAQELYDKIQSIHIGSSFDYYLIPESDEPSEFPNASNWVVPGWERNNCFIASTLTLLTAVNFFERTKSKPLPKIKMTRSRFKANFLELVKDSSANFWNPKDNYLTEEGKWFKDSEKGFIDEGIASCQALSSFRTYLESVNPTVLNEAAINELKAFFSNKEEIDEVEKNNLNRILSKYCSYASLPPFDIDQKQLSKIKKTLNSELEKLDLYALFNSCLVQEVVKVKIKLLARIDEIEKNETEEFKLFLESFLNRIIKGASTEDLKLDLREIREYLINHGRFDAGVSGMGRDLEVFYPLAKLLFPERDNSVQPFYKSQIRLINNRIHVCEKIDSSKTLQTAGFLISANNHYTVSIFNGTHYVWIDQFKDKKTLTPEQMFKEISKMAPNTSFNFIFDPEKGDSKHPDPAKWTIPGWERNNCFIAASLILLALVHYQSKQNAS